MKMIPTISAFTVMASFAISCNAGVWEEREYLERYMKQLDTLNQTVLAKAAESADPNARITLNYSKLQHDVNQIARKIEHHLKSPLEEYRSIDFPIEPQEKSSTEGAGE